MRGGKRGLTPLIKQRLSGGHLSAVVQQGVGQIKLRMMLEDARPSLLITSEDQLARFSDIPGLESLCTDLRGRGINGAA